MGATVALVGGEGGDKANPSTFPEAISLAWVHGMEVRPYPESLSHGTHIWHAIDRPSWREGHVDFADATCARSCWSRRKRRYHRFEVRRDELRMIELTA